jgi:histidinol dehydrogenase
MTGGCSPNGLRQGTLTRVTPPLRVLWHDKPEDSAPLAALFARTEVLPEAVEQAARRIIADVRARGDGAVRELTERLEGRKLDALELDATTWRAEAQKAPAALRATLERAVDRVAWFHEKQRETGYVLEEPGGRFALRVEPLARVGLYVPGGTARYPSSVVMTAVPARVAGVRELVMVTPGPSPETLLAAEIAGVDRVFVIGGAQAVAALAYGTESVPRVDKIVGPGNAWVAAAKRLVFGDVDIDAVAGPSEVLVIADDSADPEHLASDLLAQAEHDVAAIPVLVCIGDRRLAEIVAALESQLATLPRHEMARRSLAEQGAVIIVPDLAEAVRLANRFAPEHLELHVEDARTVAESIRSAGAIFVGPYTPEAAGDYLAGPNHVLPTGGAARYASPLGVYDFVKRISVLELSREGLEALADDIDALATVEGLEAHARSVRVRLRKSP